MSLHQSIKDHPHFTIHNLPYGIYSTAEKNKRVGVAVGNYILDMSALFDWGIFHPEIKENVFNKEQLNDFIALGKDVWTATRNKIQDLLINKQAFIDERRMHV